MHFVRPEDAYEAIAPDATRLVVLTVPSRLRVRIGTHELGPTPLRADRIPPGRYTVTISVGEQTFDEVITVERGRPAVVDLAFEEAPLD